MTSGTVEPLAAAALFAEAELSAERVKSTLARALHDELGCLLLAALMDAGWVEQHIDLAPDVRSRLRRIQEVLSHAIEKQRSLLEEIRPSLLDTMGLFAAARWHHRKMCKDAVLDCSGSCPDDELPFSDPGATALYRIIEEALLAATRHPSVRSLHLSIERRDSVLAIDVRNDGDAMPRDQRDQSNVVSFGLLEHRVRALGGAILITSPAEGGMHMTARIPLSNVMLS